MPAAADAVRAEVHLAWIGSRVTQELLQRSRGDGCTTMNCDCAATMITGAIL
jgi:hypothetical protein